MKILVLAGGDSDEREISLRSGDNVATALQVAGHTVVRADPAATGLDLAQSAREVDMVFPILHGANGEDGVLQAELEQLNVPFLGSGSTASHLAFDKVAFTAKMTGHHIRTPRGEAVTAETFGGSDLRKRPFVLKPIDGGSSVDTFIVRNPDTPPPNMEAAFERHPRMLLEELIDGPEITVAIVGEEALPVILIIPPEGEEFDYENKYNGKSQEIVAPSQVPNDVQSAARTLALRVHQLTGCRHLSRVDIIIGAGDELCVLEINTIPGLTTESLLPKAAAKAGMDMPALVQRFVDLVQQKPAG